MFGLCSFSFNNYYIVAISWRTPFYGRYHELIGRYEISIFQIAIDLFPLTFLYHRQHFYRTWLWVRKRNDLHFASTWVYPQFCYGSIFFVGFFFIWFFFSLFFLCCVLCPMLPVSPDCPFLIDPLDLSNVCLVVKKFKFPYWPHRAWIIPRPLLWRNRGFNQ